MSIKKLRFSEPFYTMKFIDDQQLYEIDDLSIVINLGEKEILVKGLPLGRLKSTIVKNVALPDIERAIVVEGYEPKAPAGDLFAETQKQWPLMHEITGLERFKGIPVRRSPKETADIIDLYLFSVGALTNDGLHKQHDHMEVHTQLLGYGKMQKFEENNYDTLYQEEILAPGAIHEPFYDQEYTYPWHQYQSITDSIYLYIIVNF